VHHVLFYDYAEGILERREPYREVHLARIHSQRDAGRIVMAGALGNPPGSAAIVFVDVPREEIEEFARTDPYVEAGLVVGWRVEPWNLV
jgi:hypothetical protein